MSKPLRFRTRPVRKARPAGDVYRQAKTRPSLVAPQLQRKDDGLSLEAHVVVFGAGIAGLTAAHELAERNFQVVVVDPELRDEPLFSTSPDDDNPGIGGMARTQWRYLPNRADARHIVQLPSDPPEGVPTHDRPFRSFLVKWHLARDVAFEAFDLDSRRPVGFNEMRLEVHRYLARDQQLEVTLAVVPRPLAPDEFAVLKEGYETAVRDLPLDAGDTERVLGLFDFETFDAYAATWQSRWLEIEDLLGTLLGPRGDVDDLIASVDYAFDYEEVIAQRVLDQVGGDRRKQVYPLFMSDDPELRGHALVEANAFVLPGEHGFRFFPSFYRHLFDTMQRTPRMKPRQRTGIMDYVRAELGTVFDNLVPAERLVLSSRNDAPSIKLLRRDGLTLERLREFVNGLLREAGYAEEDLVRLSTKFLKYLTSSRQRREKEYEGISWYDFVEADRMSKEGRRLTEMIPGTLVGLLGSASDARTQGTVAIQCMIDQLGDGSRSDMLLNGPTDNAWLGHWHRYLASQNVQFRKGSLTDFEVCAGKVVPIVELEHSRVGFVPPKGAKEVYYVIALPLASKGVTPGAARLAERFLQVTDDNGLTRPADFAALAAFAGNSDELQRGLATPEPQGPLRHLSGIQYFFAQELRLWRGHTQYLDAHAGLTAIAQPQFWTDPRNLLTGYRSVLSVDLGTFAPPKHHGRPIPGTSTSLDDYPWGKSHKELAALVWKQLTESHRGDFPEGKAQMPLPAAFHVDQNLVLVPEPGKDPVIGGNDSPYLVNVKGKFRSRPGMAAPPSCDNGWRADIRYEVAHGQYVLAGTHMQTFTRITSMESACESGRHAVNALLTAMKLSGEHCAIFDPEDHEPDVFTMARELDDRLCTKNARHVVR